MKTRAVQRIVDLVYIHNLPVQLTLQQDGTPGGLRVLKLDFAEADALLAEWLISQAASVNEGTDKILPINLE